MGNAHNRNKRNAARPRHGPQRNGAGADRKSGPQLVTPATAPRLALTSSAQENAPGGETADDRVTGPAAGEPLAKAATAQGAGEVDTADRTLALDPAPEASEPEAPPSQVAEGPVESPPASVAGPEAPHDAVPEPTAAQAPSSPMEAQPHESGATGEARPARGRFERFYAPGQGPGRHLGERQNGVTPPSNARNEGEPVRSNGHAPYQPGAPASPIPSSGQTPAPVAWRPETAPSHEAPQEPPAPRGASGPRAAAGVQGDDVEESEYTGPREDVRGPVGELIDSLHELFERDRAAASQNGGSRCGLCYFHFTLGELIYREAEGFYVCRSCERALGTARVPMVRRQQRL